MKVKINATQRLVLLLLSLFIAVTVPAVSGPPDGWLAR